MKPAKYQLRFSIYGSTPKTLAEGTYKEVLAKVPRLVSQLQSSLYASLWIEVNGKIVHECSIDYFGTHFSKYVS
ncbi:hypothetical protein ABGV42_00260 [Paenibacillus pabuli]|uniref:hypothetical protein n=1 Tax=Paenibacillus pabuli TaxID=1472 RepID=UPI003241CA18